MELHRQLGTKTILQTVQLATGTRTLVSAAPGSKAGREARQRATHRKRKNRCALSQRVPWGSQPVFSMSPTFSHTHTTLPPPTEILQRAVFSVWPRNKTASTRSRTRRHAHTRHTDTTQDALHTKRSVNCTLRHTQHTHTRHRHASTSINHWTLCPSPHPSSSSSSRPHPFSSSSFSFPFHTRHVQNVWRLAWRRCVPAVCEHVIARSSGSSAAKPEVYKSLFAVLVLCLLLALQSLIISRDLLFDVEICGFSFFGKRPIQVPWTNTAPDPSAFSKGLGNATRACSIVGSPDSS